MDVYEEFCRLLGKQRLKEISDLTGIHCRTLSDWRDYKTVPKLTDAMAVMSVIGKEFKLEEKELGACIKLTKEEVANRIISEGTLLDEKYDYKDYLSFGCHWRIEYTRSGNVRRIYQLDEEGSIIHL